MNFPSKLSASLLRMGMTVLGSFKAAPTKQRKLGTEEIPERSV
jgi:hypothetical protein